MQTNHNGNSQLNPYLLKEILEATPQQLILKIYDLAIISCRKENLVKANGSIQALANALNFENKEAAKISIGLLRLYKFCQEKVRENNFNIVIKILSELREAWSKAFVNI